MCPNSAEQILANEWLIINRKKIRRCPDGTKISEYACEKRQDTFPHKWTARDEGVTDRFITCRRCEHYRERKLSPEQQEILRKLRFNNQDQGRIDECLKRKRNKKRDI